MRDIATYISLATLTAFALFAIFGKKPWSGW
jgi:hypothetical protein